ncbi:MAG: PadR family transcriptional regulator [bacterium]
MTRRKSSPPAESLLPLPSATFDIILALVDDERHGYAIMKEVSRRTGGATTLGAGTLYGALKRLVVAGIVEETEKPDPESGDERRRYYRLTDYGVAVAKAEARRLGGVVREAQRLRLVGRLA